MLWAESVSLKRVLNQNERDLEAREMRSGHRCCLAKANSPFCFTYDPENEFQDFAQGETAQVTFDYTIQDEFGVQATGTVTIAVLTNDSDPDINDMLSATGASDPANGSVVVNGDGTITYTSDGGFTGADTFTYDISDGNGGTSTATVTVN